MAIFKRFGRKKRRKYPIKRDETGKSARSRCFEMFEERIPTGEIAERVGVQINTVSKYYQQWKKNPKLEQQLAYFKVLLKKPAPDRERTIELVSKICGIPKEQVEEILHQPHGLRRILTGKFYFPAHVNADHRRYVALELAFLISDHLIKNGGKFEDVYFAFQCWMKEYKEYREEKDEDTKEDNNNILFIRRIIEAERENEQSGRVQPERLSLAERDTIMKWGIQSAIKNAEIAYWLRISEFMAGGITMEQAREKIYQNLIEKGDPEGAKALRAYQNVVHPVKADDQLPPSLPSQPPSPPKDPL